MRNDGRLLSGHTVHVDGDPGLDVLWLEGSAGWRIEYLENEVRASVPLGTRSMIQLAIQPELGLRVLPVPPFVSDPTLSDVPAYPGLRDKRMTAGRVVVSRGGFVKFSAEQLHGQSTIDVTNGIANVVVLSPALLAGAQDSVEIIGDRDLDLFLPIDLTPVSGAAAGTTEWRANGSANASRSVQRVIVHGLDVRLRPAAIFPVK